MKKVKIILLVIVLIILIGIVIYCTHRNNSNYVIIEEGYSNYESKIISNYQEYMEFIDYINSQNKFYGKTNNFNVNKYKEEYFENKALAIINITTGKEINDISISSINNLLICKVDINYEKETIADIVNGKLILVEIDKNITEFKLDFS